MFIYLWPTCLSPIHNMPHPDPASPTPTYAMGPEGRNMPGGIASNGKVSYSVQNLDSALTMLMAVFVYGEKVVEDNKQIALGNTTGGVEHL
ncbi:hypothetical protein ElyMa_000670200 [Elysia marginata]|uniref:Uncharacterized protein n=1 Tax=Elysia marginata TaxID=1093978 RepID=A0AAV4GF59_9GAST|nr:hypothetical protein ElyMa_000670200 [Elysia marginata]